MEKLIKQSMKSIAGLQTVSRHHKLTVTRSGLVLRCDMVAALWRYLSDLLLWTEPDFWDCFCENAFAWDSSVWSSDSRLCFDGSVSRTEQYVVNRFICKQTTRTSDSKRNPNHENCNDFHIQQINKISQTHCNKTNSKLKTYIRHLENRSLLSLKYINRYFVIILIQKCQ